MKKYISMLILICTLLSMFCACGEDKVVETEPDGGFKQGKKCIVAYNSSGYGDTWLRAAEKAFEAAYADEGYDIELKISYGYEYDAALEIGKGPEKNDIDLYIGAGNMESLLNASKKTMRDGGAVLVDLKDTVWNKPAISANRKEESRIIADRYLLDTEYLYYDGAITDFHGGIYALPLTIGSCGIVLNTEVVKQ